jgi:hypothetical protein
MRNTFLKTKTAELLSTRASFQTFMTTVKNKRHVNSDLKYRSLHSVQKCGWTGARNVIRSIMNFILGPWAESSSNAEYARDFAP